MSAVWSPERTWNWSSAVTSFTGLATTANHSREAYLYGTGTSLLITVTTTGAKVASIAGTPAGVPAPLRLLTTTVGGLTFDLWTLRFSSSNINISFDAVATGISHITSIPGPWGFEIETAPPFDATTGNSAGPVAAVLDPSLTPGALDLLLHVWQTTSAPSAATDEGTSATRRLIPNQANALGAPTGANGMAMAISHRVQHVEDPVGPLRRTLTIPAAANWAGLGVRLLPGATLRGLRGPDTRIIKGRATATLDQGAAA